MSITADSPLLTTDPLRIETQAFAAHVNRLGGDRAAETREYIEAVVSGALRMGIDPVVMLAQWWLETDAGRSQWWVKGLNPAGIGITGDPAQNAKAQTWQTGTEAAYGHLAHMAAYIWGEEAVDHWPGTWPDLVVADRRFGVAVYAYGGEADTLRDLNGTWAIDPENRYQEKLASRANAIVRDFGQGGSTPMPTVTFGRVPHPAHTKRIATNNTAWNDLGPRTMRGVVWHRMIGTLWGTDSYFRGGAPALTDYGIGVAAEEPNDAGTILMWNDPQGRRAPWANGTVSDPYGDGKAFLDRYGVSAVNRDLASIEISGRSWNTPLDAKSRAAIVALTAYWADQYKVSHETFPVIPAEDNRSFVIWHQEFTIGTGKVCPGNVVMAETSALIAAVKETLRGYQEAAEPVPPPPAYATPSPVPKGTQLINDHLFLAPGGKTVQVAAAPRLWADVASPATGPDYPVGHKFTQEEITHYVQSTAGDIWVVLTDGSRFPALSFVKGD